MQVTVDRTCTLRTSLCPHHTKPFVAGALQNRCWRPCLPAIRCCSAAPRKALVVRALSEETELTEVPEPEDARGAIAVGLKLYNAGNHKAALDMFVRALELPGTGIKRFRDKPKLVSDGERQAALFNIACCYSRMGQMREGLAAVAGCLEAGYQDVGQLRADADLEFLRQDERFEGLLTRFRLGEAGGGGFFGSLLKGFGR